MLRRRRHRAGQQTGFTLIELLVTLSVLAILATVAAPAMVSLVDRNTLAARTNAVNATLRTARNEAIRGARRIELVYNSGAKTLRIMDEAENEQLHESDALSGVDVSLSADIVFSQEGHLVGPNDVVHLQITRHESRWICVFRTGIIARVDADLANNYCREPS
ncbi:pilus assembly FimT family protein [Algiphilus aromaticivorans]|jgi:type IV fimbrial biogenesis protein FimT|uniref:pilus assembly FimT family protein n=1 Tax=Algiphilus aromaticivorans TaxID=382454 RepID=UPI00069498D9|nr:GspH/FimT family pseudopilin [Algiphilus aromaticivorans]